MNGSTVTTPPVSDRATIRAELAEAQATFQALLGTLSQADWRRKSPASAWSVGELVAHLTWSVEQLPFEIAAAQQGKGMFNMPGWLRDLLNLWYTRLLVRQYAHQTVAQRYAAAMGAVNAVLDTVQDDEWHRGARFFGEHFFSVEDLCHTPSQHLAEHRLTISQILGRPDHA